MRGMGFDGSSSEGPLHLPNSNYVLDGGATTANALTLNSVVAGGTVRFRTGGAERALINASGITGTDFILT
jgi:hypothetical protein